MSETYQIFLLRGLARESRHWGDFISDLETAYRDHGKSLRIEQIDLPGTGRHSEMISPLTIDGIADFARDKMREILAKEVEKNIEPATHRRLVAISLGGMVAASWVSRYPSDFHSLVLINSSFRGISKAQERLRWDSWWRIPFVLGANLPEAEAQILKWVSNRSDRRTDLLPKWIHIQETRPVLKTNLSIQLLAAARFQAPAHLLKSTLVLSSRQDRMVHPDCSVGISRHYKTDMQHHPTAGHDMTIDAGPWVASRIVEW